MKKLTKITSMVLCTVLAAGALSACGGTGVSTSDNMVTIWSGGTGGKSNLDKVIQEFNDTIGKKKDIKIIAEAKENMNQAMSVALQSGQAPTLFQQGSVAEYSEKGWIVALDDLPGGPELIEKYKDLLVDNKQTYKGKTYSLPSAKTTYGIVYNKDLFKAAGIVDENGEAKAPETLDDVREYAKILTDDSKKQYGIVFPLKWTGWFSTEVANVVRACAGYTGYDPVTGQYDYSCYKPVLEMIMGIKADNSYMPGAEGLDNDPARARFSNGTIGMKFAANWDVEVFNDQFPAKFDWGVAPMPTISKDEKYLQNVVYNTGYKISKTSVENGDPEKIMFVYSWLLSDEALRKLYLVGNADPIHHEIVADIDKTQLKKGYKEFSELGDISKLAPLEPQVDISGEITLEQNFIDNVWAGKMTIDEAIENQNKIMNDGIKKYKEINPDYDLGQFILPEWNTRR